ncbi:MAG TPA: hypothetical protein VFX67_09685, partial [Burkholderiales bacterium]|nr:hypothetical protein [Burkholderiales bacterium]
VGDSGGGGVVGSHDFLLFTLFHCNGDARCANERARTPLVAERSAAYEGLRSWKGSDRKVRLRLAKYMRFMHRALRTARNCVRLQDDTMAGGMPVFFMQRRRCGA